MRIQPSTLASALLVMVLLVVDCGAFLLPTPAAPKHRRAAVDIGAGNARHAAAPASYSGGGVRCWSAASAEAATAIGAGLGLGSGDRAAASSKLMEWYSKNGFVLHTQTRQRSIHQLPPLTFRHPPSTRIKDSKVKVGASPAGTGLGLLATSAIKRGEQVLIVPMALALSMDTVRAGPVGKATGGWEPNLGETALIAVQLLYEAAQGDKSKCVSFSCLLACLAAWPVLSLKHTLTHMYIHPPSYRYAAFLQALPLPGQDSFDHPLFYSPQELAVLSQSSTRDLKEQLVDACEADFASLATTVLAPGGIPGLSPKNVDLPTFKWAVATVLSRAFFAEGGLRLCPLLDMANHGAAAQGNEPEAAGLGIFGGKGLRVVADRDYKAGEEVRISYGPKSAVEFLEDHGFVPSVASEGELLREGFCELAFEVTEADQFLDDKEDILTSSDLTLRQAFDVRADGDVDGAMVQFLRLKCLKDADAFLLEAVFRQDVLRFVELPVSEANENAVDELIMARCQEVLDGFRDAQTLTLAALEGSNQVGEATRRRLEAMGRVRESERAALEATKAWAERDLTTSDIKEWYQERRLNDLGLSGPLADDEMVGSAGGRSVNNLDW